MVLHRHRNFNLTKSGLGLPAGSGVEGSPPGADLPDLGVVAALVATLASVGLGADRPFSMETAGT